MAAYVFRRVLSEALRRTSGFRSPLQTNPEMVDAFAALISDGKVACHAHLSADHLRILGDAFYALVHSAILRSEEAALGRCAYKPSLQGLREVLDHVVPALQNVRHAQELLFENAHRPVKRATKNGNGQDSAERAMERVRQCDFDSR